jgi:hypothetical protein
MQTDIKAFLDEIETIKPSNLSTFILSKGKDAPCQPLTFKQQKQLISTISEGLVSPLKFQKALNDIIIENTSEKNLQILDRALIALEMRKASIGSVIKHEDIEYDVLDSMILKLKNLKFTPSAVYTSGVSVEVEIPTLETENQILSACMDLLKKEGDKDVGKSLSELYTYELVKYIKSVQLNDIEVSFKNISVKDRVTIVNTLPLTINKEITTFIQTLKTEESDALSFEDTEGNVRYLNIDVSFFDS